MALRFSAIGDYLNRTSNLPSVTNVTMMCWAKGVTDDNLDPDFLTFGPAGSVNFMGLVWLNNDAPAHVGLRDGNGTLAFGNLGTSTWIHLAFTCTSGTNGLLGYYNGVLGITRTRDLTVTAGEIAIGSGTEHSACYIGRIAAIKIYAAVLTEAEIQDEMFSHLPRRTANLNSWYPCVDTVVADNAKDYSGNGYNMTVVGSPTVEEGPPIPWRVFKKKFFYSSSGAATPINAPMSEGLFV